MKTPVRLTVLLAPLMLHAAGSRAVELPTALRTGRIVVYDRQSTIDCNRQRTAVIDSLVTDVSQSFYDKLRGSVSAVELAKPHSYGGELDRLSCRARLFLLLDDADTVTAWRFTECAQIRSYLHRGGRRYRIHLKMPYHQWLAEHLGRERAKIFDSGVFYEDYRRFCRRMGDTGCVMTLCERDDSLGLQGSWSLAGAERILPDGNRRDTAGVDSTLSIDGSQIAGVPSCHGGAFTIRAGKLRLPQCPALRFGRIELLREDTLGITWYFDIDTTQYPHQTEQLLYNCIRWETGYRRATAP